MENYIEDLDRTRRRMLLGFLVAFTVWQIPTILQEALDQTASRPLLASLATLAAVAAVVWIGYAVRLARLRQSLDKDPRSKMALNDERVRSIRRAAFQFGFWVVLAYLVVARLAVMVVPVSAGLATQTGLLIAGMAPVAAFLYLDRE